MLRAWRRAPRVDFIATPLEGAWVLEPRKLGDERGYFARMWDASELGERGLCGAWVQSSVSFNAEPDTLRGMHFQAEPHPEIKLVTCVAGAIFDAIIDLRPDSPTFMRSFGLELTPENRFVLYVPAGFAHGFLTLAEDSVVQYHMSEYYHPGLGRGVRWNDPAFGIEWPSEPTVISERDASYPDFHPVA
jgi:dTDP-4-dehydrorhamnose 3,5-epimerase